jgi:hypothetical protein
MQMHRYTPSARATAEWQLKGETKNGSGNTANAAIEATSQAGPL